MSTLLESAAQLDAKRAADLAATDADMGIEQQVLLQADIDYLNGAQAREAERMRELAALELAYHERAGWLL